VQRPDGVGQGAERVLVQVEDLEAPQPPERRGQRAQLVPREVEDPQPVEVADRLGQRREPGGIEVELLQRREAREVGRAQLAERVAAERERPQRGRVERFGRDRRQPRVAQAEMRAGAQPPIALIVRAGWTNPGSLT
jgi:hypothetical protein